MKKLRQPLLRWGWETLLVTDLLWRYWRDVAWPRAWGKVVLCDRYYYDALVELAKLLDGGVKEGMTDPDAVPETPEEPVTKPGDLWLLGTYTTCPHCGEVNE